MRRRGPPGRSAEQAVLAPDRLGRTAGRLSVSTEGLRLRQPCLSKNRFATHRSSAADAIALVGCLTCSPCCSSLIMAIYNLRAFIGRDAPDSGRRPGSGWSPNLVPAPVADEGNAGLS